MRITAAAVLVLLGLVALTAGIRVRQWSYDATADFRFTPDIDRGFRYGHRAYHEGFLDLYDRVLAETLDLGRYNEFDYAPLRLGVMTTWAWINDAAFPGVATWRQGRAFTAPVLRVNMLMELLAAIGALLLVELWWRRTHPPADDGWPLTSWAMGGLAAGLLWLNPAMILSGHGWPTWDLWIVPFFIWALLLVSLDAWFVAGLVIGFGALFKGQQLLVAPLFVLAPLLRGRPGNALRWAIGFAMAVAIVSLPWAVTHRFTPEVTRTGRDFVASLRRPESPLIDWRAVGWIIAAVGSTALALLGRYLTIDGGQRRICQWLAGAMGITAILLAWPDGTTLAVLVAALALAGYVAARFRPEHGRDAVAAMAAIAPLSCFTLFDASIGWFRIGWAYGTTHWPFMVMGLTSNIPGILARRFDIPNGEGLLAPRFDIPPDALLLWPDEPFTVNLKLLFAVIYGVGLALCAFAAARHLRRGDGRLLLAAVTPWLLLFTVLGQIHERYLLWAAALSVLLIVVHRGFFLAHLFLTAVTFVMTFHVMVRTAMRHYPPPEQAIVSEATARQWLVWMDATHPDIGWGVAVLTVVYLVMTVSRSARSGDWPNLPPQDGVKRK